MKLRNKVLIIFGILLLFCGGTQLLGKTVVIRGGEIHTMDGKVIRSGVIVIQDGKISEIGESVRVPEQAEVIQAEGFVLYPGFIAPSCLLVSEEIKDFESISPDSSALDRFNFYKDYTLYLAGGITSVYAAMPANRLIPGRGAVVKLAKGLLGSQIVKKEASLSVNLGKRALLPPMTDIFPAPVSPENPLTPSIKQFPSAVLGAFWAVQGLFRFEPYSGDLIRYMENISSSLSKAKEKKLPLIIHCQKAADIHLAVELAGILDMPLIIHGAAEAHKLADTLKKNNVSVIAEAHVRPNGFFPREESLTDEWIRIDLKGIPALIKEGITVGITPEDDAYLPDLFWVTQYFRRYGVSEEELIKTITINPARMFGVDDRIGSLEIGKDADILFFKRDSGKPLQVLKKVMIEGKIVHEE